MPVPRGPVSAESLFPRPGAAAAGVGKPIQYVGGELNSRRKDWDSVVVRCALMYPDAYEVGLPNQGVQIQLPASVVEHGDLDGVQVGPVEVVRVLDGAPGAVERGSLHRDQRCRP